MAESEGRKAFGRESWELEEAKVSGGRGQDRQILRQREACPGGSDRHRGPCAQQWAAPADQPRGGDGRSL